MFSHQLSVCVALLAVVTIVWTHQMPDEAVLIFDKGFMVSIPAKPGISLFAFHGKLNERFNGLEAGTWSHDATVPKYGLLSYTNNDAILKPGDVLHYWLYVIKNGAGYQRLDRSYRV